MFMDDKLLKRLELICLGHWYMDFDRGLLALSEFVNEIMLAESGMFTGDLAEKRNSSILTISNGGYFVSRRNQDGSQIEIQPGSIAKLNLTGVMKLNDGASSLGTRSLEREINFAKHNPNIVGAILEVASGGGESFSANHMHTVMSSFGKPYVAAVHYADSAAYMAILSANEIIGLGDMSETGSIGALWQVDKDLLNYIKNGVLTVYSDKSPQKNGPFNKALDGDFSGIKKELNANVSVFHKAVIKHRKLDPKSEMTKDTLEGGVFTGKEGIARGLVDRLGSMDTAIERLKVFIKYSK